MKKLFLVLFLIPNLSLATPYVVTSSVILKAGDMSQASLTSLPVDMSQTINASIQASFSGAPVGTMILQFSDDVITYTYPNGGGPTNANANPCSNVVNWTTYNGSSTLISAAGNFGYNLFEAGYRCIRLVYTKTSGTGSLTATFTGKGH